MLSRKSLVVAAVSGLLTVAAHAQYTAPASTGGTPGAYANDFSVSHNQWEIDGGIGFLAATNLDGVDNGFALHIGGYYLDPVNSTRESTLKYGVEYFYGNADGGSGGNHRELDTHFFSANLGYTYRFSQRFEAGIVGGLGFGALDYSGVGGDRSSGAFGYQLRPEITGWITDKVGVSLSYRFLHTVALDNDWGKNPIQHAIEFAVKVRF